MNQSDMFGLIDAIHKQRNDYNRAATEYAKLQDSDERMTKHAELMLLRENYFKSLESFSDNITPFIDALLNDISKQARRLAEYEVGDIAVHKHNAIMLAGLYHILGIIVKPGTHLTRALVNPKSIESPGHRKKALIDVQIILKNVFKEIGFNY